MSMSLALWILVGLAVVTPLSAAIRRAPIWVWLVLFAGSIPALSLVWLLLGVEQRPFVLVKLLSVAIGALGIAALRSLRPRGPWLSRALWLALAINILEACLREGSEGHLVNPLAGLLLILAMAGPRHLGLRDDELRWELGWHWVIGYTLWNFTFLYALPEAGEVTGRWSAAALIHLGAPLLMIGRDASRYVEARAIALFVVVAWISALPEEPWMRFSDWHNPMVAELLQRASLGVSLALVAKHVLAATAPASPARLLGRRLLARRS
ncbi:MAG: hypothetical protein H6711_02945 [Myxococcales bacterium]|nr:hypothetical protein [Myxococcales bacterium]